MCPEFHEVHEVPIPQLTAYEMAQQQQNQQQHEEPHEEQGYEQSWDKRPRVRGGLKLRAKQALHAAARGDFHTAQQIAKGNSRRESLL